MFYEDEYEGKIDNIIIKHLNNKDAIGVYLLLLFEVGNLTFL